MPIKYDKKPSIRYDEKPTQKGYRGSVADPLAQGATLGFADEIAGFAGALPAAFATGDWDLGKHYRGIRDKARGQSKNYAEDNPVTSTVAELGGALLTGGAGAARLAGLKGAQLVGRSASLGAGMGALGGVGYSEADDFTEDALKGGALGGALGAAVPATGQAFAKAKNAMVMRGAQTDPYKKAAQLLQRHGVPLTRAQQTNTGWARQAETTLADVPFSGKPLQNVFERQRKAFQKKLFQMTGLDDGSDMLTRENLDKLSSKLSGEYAQALKGKSINLAGDDFLNNLGYLEAKHSRLVDSRTKNKVRQIVSEFLDEAESGAKTGEWYQEQRSLFAKRAKANSEVAELYADLKIALDDEFARVAGKMAKGNLDARYAQYKQLERLHDRVAGGASGAEGFIPPGQLAKEAGKNPGTKEWREFTRAAAAVFPDRLGNSGTAQRNYILGALAGGQGMGAIMDPASLVYGPLAGRAISRQLATGGPLDVSALVPSGRTLSRIGPAPAALSGQILPSPD